MLNTMREMFEENWQWRRQIFNLAKIDVQKECRGTLFGWAWLFVKPLMYIAVFWFALEMGLRAGSSTGGDYPYILWLVAGLVPWLTFIQPMIGAGANVYRRYPFLVTRIRFPLSAISTFFAVAKFFVFLAFIALVVLVVVVTRVSLSLHALQLIPIAALMLLYFVLFSIMVSPLSAMSKDFSNFLKAISTPLFWASGIIYNVASLPIDWLQTVLAFNPITFFVQAFRASLCDKFWIWEKPEMLIPFLVVFALTAFAAVRNYKNLRRDVADVL